MGLPINIVCKVREVFGDKDININLYSGLTVFIGPNGSGKTKVMKQLKSTLTSFTQGKIVRYLSSNRLGSLEQFRSQTMYYASGGEPTLGDINFLKGRHNIEVATGDFFTMDARKDVYIKVSERLRVLFKRDIFLRWDSGNLKVHFGKTGSSDEYSISVEASGLINVISILAALYDDEVSVLLIDEPEVSLHPQLQAFVLKELKQIAGDPIEQNKKLIIIATHSIDMLDIQNVNDLPNLVFFLDDGSLPRQINPDAQELQSNKIKELIPRLGQAHKTAFFSKRPLLVEGISDSLFCNYFDDRFKLFLGTAGTQVVPINGKGEFAAITKLMRMLGKNPVVLADLDAFVDDNSLLDLYAQNELAKKEALSRGHADFPTFSRNVKSDFCNICDKYWNELKDIFQVHPYWKNRGKENDDEIKAKRRAVMAILVTESDDTIKTWLDYENWLNIKIRINVLFDCLQKAGCYILRKGTIESYYTHSDKETSTGKPSAAIEEIEFLKLQTDEFIKNNYNNILEALNYSAKKDVIDESDAIKRELLSEVAPILHILSKETSGSDIISIIRQARGSNNTLFKYEPLVEGDIPAVRVELASKIINVSGFPFTIRKGSNVNEVVNQIVKHID